MSKWMYFCGTPPRPPPFPLAHAVLFQIHIASRGRSGEGASVDVDLACVAGIIAFSNRFRQVDHVEPQVLYVGLLAHV